jgi:hypothetical protein
MSCCLLIYYEISIINTIEFELFPSFFFSKYLQIEHFSIKGVFLHKMSCFLLIYYEISVINTIEFELFQSFFLLKIFTNWTFLNQRCFFLHKMSCYLLIYYEISVINMYNRIWVITIVFSSQDFYKLEQFFNQKCFLGEMKLWIIPTFLLCNSVSVEAMGRMYIRVIPKTIKLELTTSLCGAAIKGFK